ncbi:MAG: GAF domain-containing protein, partial [Deltaproteobacteria bacterium]|nr:GAF domain-containing protein [Deltaproteobacteria bacterium]
MLEITHQLLVGLDVDGRIVLVNRRACETLGRSEAELLGRDWFETCVPAAWRRTVRGVFQRTVAGELEPARRHENPVLTAVGEERLVLWRNTILRDDDGAIRGTLASGDDITDRRRDEDALRLSEERLTALLALARRQEEPEPQLIDFALEEAVRLTRSRVGYLHFVRDDQVHLDLFTWSKDVHAACTAEKRPQYPLTEAGVWADCVRRRGPVVHNDYPGLPGKRGLPEGHFPILRHLSVPVMDGERVVAVAGVGNKDAPYDDSDVRQMQLFMQGMWSVLAQQRARRSRAESLERLRQTLRGAVDAISHAVELRDPYTAGHQRRSADLARAIAVELGLDAERVEAVRTAGSIHDIGKLKVPTEILVKPGKLTAIEYGLVQLHPRTGFEVLRPVDFPWPLAEIVLQHHERLDGSGYPSGLSGDRILLEARVLAVADIVEAMASHRPYRPALGIPAALEELQRQRGRQLDADVVDACRRVVIE